MPLADDAWLLSPPAPPKSSNPSSEERLFQQGPNLTDKEEVQCCQGCKIKFSLVLRKHNCKVCGRVFCGKCSCVVHLIKLNEKKSTRRTEEAIQRSRDNSLNSLSVKLLGVRVCSACQDIDSATVKIFSRKKSKPLNNCNNIAKNYSSLSTKSPANNELGNKENIGCDLQLFRVLQNSSNDMNECNRDNVKSKNDNCLSPISTATTHHYSHPTSSSSTSFLSCSLHIEILQLQSSRQKAEESSSESSSSTISTSSCTQLLQDSIAEEFRHTGVEVIENIPSSGFRISEGNSDEEKAIVIGTSPDCESHPVGRKDSTYLNHRSSQSLKGKGRIGASIDNSLSWYWVLCSCFATIGCGCIPPPSAATTRTEFQ